MMLNEQQLEDLCLTWLADAGWQVVNELKITPDADQPACSDYRQVWRDKLLSVEFSVSDLQEIV